MWIIPKYISIENNYLCGCQAIPIQDIKRIKSCTVYSKEMNSSWYEVHAVRKGDLEEFLLLTLNFEEWAIDIAEEVRQALYQKGWSENG